MLLGLRLLLLMGPTLPLPAPPNVAEALKSVQITEREEGRSGFQMTFETGRGGPQDLLDYPLVLHPLMRPFTRIVLVGQFNAQVRVLLDGIVTTRSLAPGSQPGGTTVTLTGEDLGVLMDMEEKRAAHPAMDHTMIVTRILASYLRHGIVPDIRPPLIPDPALPVERIPTQQGTDLAHIKTLAAQVGHVFHITPGPAPGMSTAYWGPPQRAGIPQSALSVDMGPGSNVLSIRFETNGLAPIQVIDEMQDDRLGISLPVLALVPLRVPPLVPLPAWAAYQPNVRTKLLPQGGGNYTQAMNRAQALVDSASDAVVTATGELDVVRYGTLLQSRGLVGLRGAGFTHDGLYYVKSVNHKISRGSYRQEFTLTREGDGSLTPVVRP